MRSFFRNFKVFAVALLLILSIGLLVACGTSPNTLSTTQSENSTDATVDEGIIGEDVVIDEVLENVTYYDESQIVNCQSDVKFEVNSTIKLTNENISNYITVTDRNGAAVPISVIESGLSTYEISKFEGLYEEGETYLITINDANNIFFVGHEDQTVLSFSIDKAAVAICEEKSNIVKLNEGVSFVAAETGILVDDGTIGVGSILLLTYQDGAQLYVKVDSVELKDKKYLLKTVDATFTEIYEKLDVYSLEQFDCSLLDLDSIDEATVTQSIENSEMFYKFVTAVEEISEANPALSLPDLKDFEISFDASVNGDKNIVIDAIIAYKGGYTAGDQVGKLYVELKYNGVISYDIKASIQTGLSVDYDFAVTANTTHKISLAVQWLDAEDDVIIANDEELANEINAIMADKGNIPSKVLGEAKSFGKKFEIPLCKDFTYIIPNTPITANVGFSWIIGIEVQGEIFTAIEMESSDTLGVRSTKIDGEDSQECYHIKSKDTNNKDLALFGTARIRTGVGINAYFSIVGMSKKIKIGIKGNAGVYLEVKGITAKAESTEEKIGVLYGEVGLFVEYEVYGKIFIQFKIVGDTYYHKLFDFGTTVIYTDFVEAETTINTTKRITLNGNIDRVVDGKNNLMINKFVVSEFGIESEALTREDFDFDIKNGYITYFGGQFYITTSQHQFTETITASLKADPEITKTIIVNYDDGYVAPVVEEEPEVTEPEAETTEPETETTEPVEETSGSSEENISVGETTEPEEITQPVEEAEPVVENLVGTLEFYNGTNLVRSLSTEYSVSYPVEGLTADFGYTFNGWFYADGTAATTLDGSGNTVYTMPINTPDTIKVFANWKKTYADYIYVSVASDLKSINANGKYFFVNNIDLWGVNWTPVKEFTGIIKGNGFTVSNFTLTSDSGYTGFVGYNKGTIEDLTIRANINCTSSKEDIYFGIIAGVNEGAISNCKTYGTINVVMKGNSFFVKEYCGYIGGVVGENKGGIYNTTTLADVYVETNNVKINPYAGGFVGINNGTISGCSANSFVESEITNGVSVCTSYAGGFAAVNNSYIFNSEARAYKNMKAEYAGGFVAINDGTIRRCASFGNLEADKNAGGLVGVNDGTISNCYSTVNISGTEKIGGLVGVNDGNISCSYASGNVKAEKSVGGLVGYNEEDATIYKCFAAGDVTSTKDNWISKEWAGGLVGYMDKDSTVTSCYRSADQDLDIEDCECKAGSIVTTSVTKSKSFYTSMLGFSTYTWNITYGYLPTLK